MVLAHAASANRKEQESAPDPAGEPVAGPVLLAGGARFVPEGWQLPSESAGNGLGVEPGGAVRAFAGGERILLLPRGALLASDTAFPARPEAALALPDRIGGGFAFVAGTTVWRADRWLGPARPLVATGMAIAGLEAGMDRLYIRLRSGARAAIDPKTGAAVAPMLPRGPTIAAYAALDGWRAAAIVDLRGVVATHDAGATWQTIELPGSAAARGLRIEGGTIAIEAEATTGGTRWFALGDARDFDRATPRLAPDSDAHAAAPPALEAFDARADFSADRPLSVAIDDGWPLDDGTALVLCDAHLSKIRLEDGARVETWDAAVAGLDPNEPLPARCHPLSLGRDGQIGFVCGAPAGDTYILRYDAASRSLVSIGRFRGARAVSAPGNGGIVVRGGCGALATAIATDAQLAHEVCLLDVPPDPHARVNPSSWRELHIAGAADGERVVPLENGVVAVLSPARGDLSHMRLTLLEGTDVRTVALHVHAAHAQPSSPLDRSVAIALRDGIWLDGVTSPAPGELAAWVDARGSVLGLRIHLDGDTTHGPWVRDLGSPMVSGLYGLGMSASRRGFETIDGGMTWTTFDAPSFLVGPRDVTHRACGPIGCNAGGWLRVGWGVAPAPTPPPALALPSAASLVPLEERVRPGAALALSCRPRSDAAGAANATGTRQKTHGEQMNNSPASPSVGGLHIGWSPSSTSTALVPGPKLPDFLHLRPPAIAPAERGFALAASDSFDHVGLVGPFADVYAWGAPQGNWDELGDSDGSDGTSLAAGMRAHWLVRWDWPYGGAREVRSSGIAAAPPMITAMTGSGVGASGMSTGIASFSIVAGDDADHALLVGGRNGPANGQIFELETSRAPLAIADDHGDPLPEVQAAVRVSGHWYLATNAPAAVSPAQAQARVHANPFAPFTRAVVASSVAVVWSSERGVARVLAQVPRIGVDGRSSIVRLARNLDGRSLALVVDGDPPADRTVSRRFAVPIDLETGARGDVMAFGMADFSDHPALALCDDASEASEASASSVNAAAKDHGGWLLDAPFPTGVDLLGGAPGAPRASPAISARLTSVVARVRFEDGGSAACIERLAAGTREPVAGAAWGREIDASGTKSTGGSGKDVAGASGTGRKRFTASAPVEVFVDGGRASFVCESPGAVTPRAGRSVQP